MISDYLMNNINHHFKAKTTLTNQQPPTLTRPHPTTTPTLSHLPTLIHNNLPTLIRRNHDPPIIINPTKPKSPSPISKSRLQIVLEGSKQDNLKAVVRRSPLRSGQITSKTSVSDLMDGRTLWEEEEKENLVEVYRQKRKVEQKEASQRSLRKVWGKPE